MRETFTKWKYVHFMMKMLYRETSVYTRSSFQRENLAYVPVMDDQANVGYIQYSTAVNLLYQSTNRSYFKLRLFL